MRACPNKAASTVRGLILSILFPVAAGLFFAAPSLGQGGGGESLCSEEEYNNDGCTLNDETTTTSTVPPETVSLHQPGLFGTSFNEGMPCYSDCAWGDPAPWPPAPPEPPLIYEVIDIVDTTCNVLDMSYADEGMAGGSVGLGLLDAGFDFMTGAARFGNAAIGAGLFAGQVMCGPLGGSDGGAGDIPWLDPDGCSEGGDC